MTQNFKKQKAELANLSSQASLTYDDYDEVGPSVFGYFGHRLVELAELEPENIVLDVAAGKGNVSGCHFQPCDLQLCLISISPTGTSPRWLSARA